MQTLLKSLVVVLVALPLGSEPSSAVLDLEAPTRYTPGDVITITVTGDSEGKEDSAISSVLTIATDLTLVGVALGTLHSSHPFIEEWTHTGTSGTCGATDLAANECLAVDAFTDSFFRSIDLLPSTLTTWQFDTTGATGDLLFLLEPRAPAGFFGLPGTQVTVTMIPEPEPVALLCAGLVALAAWRRRRGAMPLR